MLDKVEDCADDDVEEDKKRLKERSLPAHHPQVLVSMTDEACERNKKRPNLIGGTKETEGWFDSIWFIT